MGDRFRGGGTNFLWAQGGLGSPLARVRTEASEFERELEQQNHVALQSRQVSCVAGVPIRSQEVDTQGRTTTTTTAGRRSHDPRPSHMTHASV